jgi:hypothetical protein
MCLMQQAQFHNKLAGIAPVIDIKSPAEHANFSAEFL